MKKYISLVKLLFVQQFKSRVVSADSTKKRTRTAILVTVLALCFLPLLVSLAVAMFYFGKLSEGNVYVATFLTLSCQGLVLLFGLHSIISNVFTVKDADKLLYLPVRAHTIFLAKLTVVYLNELITTAVTVLFVLLPFGVGLGAGAAYYLMLLIALVLIPMLPMLVGCIVAMPLATLIAYIGKNSALKTALKIVIYLAVMGAYMYVMYSLGFFANSGHGSILDNPELYLQSMVSGFTDTLTPIMPYFHPNYMLASSMLATTFIDWLVGFAVTVGEHLALLGLVVLISLPFYRRLLALSIEDGVATVGKRNKEQYKVRNSGVVRELMVSDLKRTARDSQMGFQSFVGIIMMPIIVALLYLFMGIAQEEDASFLQLMSISPYYQVVGPLAIMAYMTLIGLGTNVLGLYPISRENKSAYILKSLPVPFKKILLAKVLLATAVMVISDFVTCLLIVLLLGVKWYYGLAILGVMSLVGFGAMCITTMLDLKSPRFGWANFNQSLKNAKNSWIAMLIGIAAVVAIALISALFVLWYSLSGAWYAVMLMWIVLFAAMFAFAAVSYKMMANRATKYFEQIEI